MPSFSGREALLRPIICASAGDGRDLMTALRQASTEVREVLGRGCHIRVEALIKQQDSHSLKLNAPDLAGPTRKALLVFSAGYLDFAWLTICS